MQSVGRRQLLLKCTEVKSSRQPATGIIVPVPLASRCQTTDATIVHGPICSCTFYVRYRASHSTDVDYNSRYRFPLTALLVCSSPVTDGIYISVFCKTDSQFPPSCVQKNFLYLSVYDEQHRITHRPICLSSRGGNGYNRCLLYRIE